MDYLTFIVCLLLTWLAIHFLLSNIIKKDPYSNPIPPPGPPGFPIIGNIFNLSTKPHITMTHLSKRYGPLMSLKLGTMPLVIITSSSMAKQALQSNDDSFSNNRYLIDAVCALNHHENSLVAAPVSEKWRNLRKICNSQIFSLSRLESSQSLRKNKVNDLITYVEECCETGAPVDIGQAAFSTTLNLLSNTLFSVDLGDPNSEFSREFKETVRGIMEELGKPNIADFFPILKKIDPQGIRKRTGIHFKKMIDLFNSIIDQRLKGKRGLNKEGENDVLDALLNNNNTMKIEPSKIPNLLVDLFTAGTDTTSSTLEWAMAELIRNPEKLKKAQQEIRETIGIGNQVQESDMTRFPYLQAVVKETLRLHPPVPFLVPRKVLSEVKLFGFTIPANAQVVVNVWAIGRDPDNWDQPESFEPERFLGSDIDVKGHDFELIPFGAGRRICPGLPMAMRMVHLMLGSLINRFDWMLEGGVSPEKLDMEEKFGFTLEKAQRLRVIPVSVG